jgi:16S rRNA (cytosine967-C5)-methyltransferase
MSQTPPRKTRPAAVKLLDAVLGEEGRLLSEMATHPVFKGLSGPEKAAAQRLATETLRSLERADRILDRHLRKRPALHVMNILRLGVVELCTGGDAHGVVGDLVGLAPQKHGRANANPWSMPCCARWPRRT